MQVLRRGLVAWSLLVQQQRGALALLSVRLADLQRKCWGAWRGSVCLQQQQRYTTLQVLAKLDAQPRYAATLCLLQ